MNIVIVGGSGYIGSHLTKVLLDAGHRVCVVDRKNELVGVKPDVCMDVDDHGVTEMVERIREHLLMVDLVVHLADDKNIVQIEDRTQRKYAGDLDEDFANPMVRTARMLRLTHALGAKRMVFASSGSVYGDSKVPAHEDDRVVTYKSSYACAKVGSERVLDQHHVGLEIHTTVLRYGNPIGCKFGYRYGTFGDEDSLGARLVKFLNDPNATFRLDVTKHGTDPMRSYIGIQRLCTATLRIIEDKDKVLGGYDVYNIGGANHSAHQILSAFLSHHGHHMNEGRIDRRLLEDYRHEYNLLNCSKFESRFRTSLLDNIGTLVSSIR